MLDLINVLAYDLIGIQLRYMYVFTSEGQFTSKFKNLLHSY